MSARYVRAGATAIATAIAVAACSPDRAPLAPPAPQADTPARIAIVSGTEQRAFTDSTLDSAIVVRVISASGAPVAGVHVHFASSAPAGTNADIVVVSDANGNAACLWQLGDAPGRQSLHVRLDETSVAAVDIAAQAIPLSQADVVIVHNATPGTISLVDFADYLHSVVYTLTWPDTIVRLVPRDSSSFLQSVGAAELGLAPGFAADPWTAQIDTVHLHMRPPVSLPLTVWVMHDYAATVSLATAHLANTDRVWQQNPFGLRVGAVRFVDATNFPIIDQSISCQSALPPSDPTTVNIYYLPSNPIGTLGSGPFPTLPDIGNFAGYDCSANTVQLGPNATTTNPYILAHEIGHSFALAHVTDPANVMAPSNPGSTATISQIFVAWYNPRSSLNAVYALNAATTVSAAAH